MDWPNQTALVTGINDMIGMHLSARLRCLGAKVVGIGDLRADTGSLTYLENEIERFRPGVVFYVPGHRHGIAMHRHYSGEIYYESVVSFAHLLEACRKAGVGKVVNVLSNCVYPDKAAVPYREADLWEGLPEQTLIPYGMARRMSVVHAATYREQYGLNTVSAILASVYGSNDNFDPKSSQVMASMITRFATAAEQGADRVVCWGSGRPTREFIHVRDAVAGLLRAAEHYDDPVPLNIGSGVEVPVMELTGIIAGCAGYRGAIEWDTGKPEGRARVCLDCTRMKQLLPEWRQLSLEEGVRETMEWFRRMEPEV